MIAGQIRGHRGTGRGQEASRGGSAAAPAVPHCVPGTPQVGLLSCDSRYPSCHMSDLTLMSFICPNGDDCG